MKTVLVIRCKDKDNSGHSILRKDDNTSLRKVLDSLEIDQYCQITFSPQKTYKTTRYKYYFASVLLTAVISFNARGMYQIENRDTGEIEPLTVEDLHEFFKYYFNPVIVKYEGMIIKKSGSTRRLSDQEFIGEYLEKILCFLAEKDVICLSFDEWRERMEAGFTSIEIANQEIKI